MTDNQTTALPKLEPLKLKCNMKDCERELHCFRQSLRKRGALPYGNCVGCNVDLVDWPRLHKRDIADIKYTFESLRHEYIRQHYWTREIDERAINAARRLGMTALKASIEKRVRSAIGKAQHPVEGRQTGWEGAPLLYAQHATGTCCRRCLEYWHGVARGEALTDDEVAYAVGLIDAYVDMRLSFISPDPVKVPRKKAKSG